MQFSIFSKYSSIILILLFLNPSFSQQQNVSNPWVSYDIKVTDGNYLIDYTFKDHFENLQHFSLSYPVELTNLKINKLGIPNWIFDSYRDTEANKLRRLQILKDGLFMLSGNTIEIDKSAVVNYYSEIFCKPVAEQIVHSLAEYGKDTRRNRIEMAMRFVQDIPYGIPEFADKERYYGGVSPPPKVLIEMYGDCDSKAMLFVGILIYLIDKDDIIFLNQSKHVLTAVRATPEKGLTFIKYHGDKFLIAETAGPGRRLFGEKGNYYSSKFDIEKLNISQTEIISFNNSLPVKMISEIGNSIILKNVSDRSLKFQVSTDKIHWKNHYLDAGTGSKFNFETEGIAYIRTRYKNNKYILHQLEFGNTYRFIWNSWKKRWEIDII
ncbi:MAG: hypothetical protein B6D61_07090 [Bacteroidetes bacterium 4484_249]|nr:MAG: hypothetical protein B6D61_07090 [Bacteroidetes bacterium 4484_249]